MARIRTLWNSPNGDLFVIAGSLVILTIIMSTCAYWLTRFPGDLEITLLFQSLKNNTLFSVMKWISYFTDGWRSILLVIVGGIVVWWRQGKFEAALTIAAGLSSLLNYAAKFVINRPRPTPDLVQVWVAEQSSSFPSGQAFYGMVFLGLMAYFAFTNLRRSMLRTLILVSLISLIVLIGASRVYLGAHWTSDVLGGYVIGALFLTMFIWLDRRVDHRDR